jgi:S-adenosylmethionine hydrolase
MDPPRIVTLTTDFGLEDGYVAQMKGAALSICPELQFVDITHHVPAHDVLAGALHLKSAYAAFPPRTVHVAVVDPGVGTARRGVVVRTTRYVFVAPDNGILSLALEDEPPGAAHLLEARHFQRPTVSATFEGRDVFAPAAAWVARGIPIERFGPEACDLARLELPAFRAEAGQPVSVRALLVDRFGNVTLNVPRRGIGRGDDRAALPRIRVQAREATIDDLRRTYGDAEPGKPFLLFNSADFLEIAVREGRACDRLGLKAGDEVVVTVG